jgi:hypothetical protein
MLSWVQVMKVHLDIDILWGGFYASQCVDSREISVFRLLDFNQHAYHAALYKKRFSTLPAEEEIVALSPFIGHVPVDTRALLGKDRPILIGRKPLSPEDLNGYMYYLEDHEVDEDERMSLTQRLIEFSNEPPLKLRLQIVDEELEILNRDTLSPLNEA